MKIIFSESAFRQLLKLEKIIQQRISNKLDFYISQRAPLEFSEKLTDSKFGQWRYRVGDYRILFDINSDKIIILKIGHRKNIY